MILATVAYSGGGTEIQSVGAGVRGCEAADYLCEASVCEGQELGP